MARLVKDLTCDTKPCHRYIKFQVQKCSCGSIFVTSNPTLVAKGFCFFFFSSTKPWFCEERSPRIKLQRVQRSSRKACASLSETIFNVWTRRWCDFRFRWQVIGIHGDKQYTYTYTCGWKYSWSHKSWRYHTVRSNLTRYHHVFLAWVLSSLLIGNRSDGSQLFRCLDTCCVFCSSLAFQFGR